MKIGFVGLGVMGFPMAGHLAAAGHALAVFNRSADKTKAWVSAHKGRAASSIAEAAAGAELFALCVGADPDVREVIDAALPALPAGAIILDHTTASAALARELAARAQAGGRAFIDAPVSGGEAGARNGTLSVMAGGEEGAFAKARPAMEAYARQITLIGGPGAGQLCKMVNQICIAGTVQGLAEAVAFAKKAGLSTDLVLAAVSKGAAGSWQMENRWKTMAKGEFEFGFAVDWMRKDLGLVLSEARANGARLELTALVDQFYAEVQAMGGRRWDTSSLAARLER
ncbi:MAG: NAD(P)-dependent oxidoreductase [Caulobacteraceae bacterium]